MINVLVRDKINSLDKSLLAYGKEKKKREGVTYEPMKAESCFHRKSCE